MSHANIEERLVRLEEGLFFQDRLLRNLNIALTEQQRQLDQMEVVLGGLREKVAGLSDLVDAANAPANTPPPHYSK